MKLLILLISFICINFLTTPVNQAKHNASQVQKKEVRSFQIMPTTMLFSFN